MDSIMYINNFFAILIMTIFKSEVEILANKLLPACFYPILLQASLGINSVIVTQIFDGIEQTILFILNSFKTESNVISHRCTIEILYRLVHFIVDDNSHP